ncbi:MAG: efflux RND transporter permease subunit [Chloroflexaceae bacterium]|nr:efflux RND transporter permease subunit [Chloroflexaceae bacterium]
MSKKPAPKLKGVAIADTSIMQPVFVTMVMLLLIVLGLTSYASMPVNLYPDFEIPVVAVQLIYPGASPDSVADQVTEPVEDTLISISGVKDITSQSFEGANLITIEFETGVDVDVAEEDVRSKVNAMLPALPREVEDPLFFKFDPGEIPVISLAVSSAGERSSVELRRVVKDDIVPFLQRIPGVGSVTVSGGQERQINVLLDLEKIQARRIPPSLITRAIEQANVNLGLGNLEAGAQKISLRAPSMIQDPQDIADIQITGTSYRIGDVARIEDGIAEVETYSRINGKEVIQVSIIKRPDANVVEVAHGIREELGKIFEQYPDLSYTIPLDSSTFVEDSVHGAIEELIVSSLAAMLIVFVFFRNLRNTLVTIIGLPVILIATFAAITLFGLTINVITLMGLSLSVGLVIDDAIVVRENIFRHTEMGKPPIIASSQGTAEVSLSVVAMTLTIIAVFVPVTFTTGIPGIIFKSFGITVACAMAISLIEAFTLAPMTSAHLFKEDAKNRERWERKEQAAREKRRAMMQAGVEDPSEEADEQVDLSELEGEHVDWMGRIYGFLLRWSLRFRWAVLLIAVVIFIASFYVATGLQFAFFPEADQGEFYVGFELQPGAPLEETNKLSLQTEAILMQNPTIDMILATVGGGSGFGGGGGHPNGPKSL